MLRIDEGGLAARALHFRDRVESDRRLAGGFRTVYFDDAASRESADAECDI